MTGLSTVSVLSIQPGDTLLVHTPGAVTPEQAQQIKDVVAAQLTEPVPIIVAPRDCQFVIVRPVTVDTGVQQA